MRTLLARLLVSLGAGAAAAWVTVNVVTEFFCNGFEPLWLCSGHGGAWLGWMIGAFFLATITTFLLTKKCSTTSHKNISKQIQKLMKSKVEQNGIKVLHISAFGYKFDSAFWIVVETDKQKEVLNKNEKLIAELKGLFNETGYMDLISKIWEQEVKQQSLDYLKTPGIVFESQQTVDRDFEGNWYHAMK